MTQVFGLDGVSLSQERSCLFEGKFSDGHAV